MGALAVGQHAYVSGGGAAERYPKTGKHAPSTLDRQLSAYARRGVKVLDFRRSRDGKHWIFKLVD